MADDDGKHQVAERQLVVFRLGHETFGVDIDKVREIIKVKKATTIPRCEEFVAGIINLRGRTVTVIDLGKRLGMSGTERTGDARIIVSEIAGRSVGLVVDACNDVLSLPVDRVENVPEVVAARSGTDCIGGVAMRDGKPILLLDLSRVLGGLAGRHVDSSNCRDDASG